jgi:hypothetical protein
MSDETRGQRRPREQERELEAAKEQRREEQARKPERTQHEEWRGAGVCGDHHTD